MWLTGSGYEVKKTFFREQRIFKPPEVQLKNACHGVDIMISLIIHQRILTYRDKIHAQLLPPVQYPSNEHIVQLVVQLHVLIRANLTLCIINLKWFTFDPLSYVWLFICTLETRGGGCGFWGGQNTV